MTIAITYPGKQWDLFSKSFPFGDVFQEIISNSSDTTLKFPYLQNPLSTNYSTNSVDTPKVGIEQSILKNNYKKNKEYLITISRVYDLFSEGEDDFGGASSPTTYALRIAKRFLQITHEELSDEFTRGVVSLSYDGGIRIEWIKKESNIRLIIPPEETGKGYVYFERGADYGVMPMEIGNLISSLKSA